MDFYISVALIGISVALAVAASVPVLKILQLSGYRASGVIGWWKSTKYENLVRYTALTLLGAIATAVFSACLSKFEYARYCSTAAFVVFEIIFIVSVKKNGDMNVKLTARMKRLIAAVAVLTSIVGAGVAWACYYSPYCQIVVAALGFFIPFIAMAANASMLPLERANNNRYVKKAKARLNKQKPVVIGITGSYGKTTAKNLLFAMLSKKHSVLATPGNFNTPMGICKTVNELLHGESVFIAELGARYKGDIKELCDIVQPKYGIITAVGDMHIATLGSREGVANVKFELASSVASDGLTVLNGYNADCAALAERSAPCRLALTGENGRASYDDLKSNADGASFVLTLDGEKFEVKTKLLGAHIPELVCACAVIAVELGVDKNDIVAAVEQMPPVEHRLQLLPQVHAGVTVIDDAYNSNPVGAKNALEVLKTFDGTRVVITPGFVELGAIEKQCNTELGKRIAENCDHAYLIGSRAADIKGGATEGGMSEDKIRIFGSRDEAVAALVDIDGPKVVLFENDLPDNIK